MGALRHWGGGSLEYINAPCKGALPWGILTVHIVPQGHGGGSIIYIYWTRKRRHLRRTFYGVDLHRHIWEFGWGGSLTLNLNRNKGHSHNCADLRRSASDENNHKLLKHRPKMTQKSKNTKESRCSQKHNFSTNAGSFGEGSGSSTPKKTVVGKIEWQTFF